MHQHLFIAQWVTAKSFLLFFSKDIENPLEVNFCAEMLNKGTTTALYYSIIVLIN